MAINPNTEYPGRVTPPDANYTYGSSKNETAPGAGDGTPYEIARANDIFGFQQALLRSASIVPSGNADTQLASEYLQAFIELASGRAFNYDDSGVADAYVLDVQANQQAPSKFFVGLIVKFRTTNVNTGACTVNPLGLGTINIKLVGGVTDPSAGQITDSGDNVLIYQTSPSVHFELVGAVSASQISAQHLRNISVDPTIAASALTIEITGQDLAALAVDNIGEVAFRSEILTDGNYDNVLTIAAVSMVLPSGGSLGFTASEDGYIYVYGINNGGTMEVAIAKRAVFDESILHSTVTVTAGSDSPITLYSTVGRSNVPIRLLGRVRIATGITPGEWNNAPTEAVPWTPSMKKTGDIIQVVSFQDGEVATGSTILPIDDSIPQNTEGDQYMINSGTTPKSSINILKIAVTLHLASSSITTLMAAALFQDSIANAIAVGSSAKDAQANATCEINFTLYRFAGTTAPINFIVRAGTSIAGTTTFNGASGTRRFNGLFASTLTVTEIQT